MKYVFSLQVARTAARPLASGALTLFDALVFLSLQLSIGCLILLELNWYSVLLGASSLGKLLKVINYKVELHRFEIIILYDYSIPE